MYLILGFILILLAAAAFAVRGFKHFHHLTSSKTVPEHRTLPEEILNSDKSPTEGLAPGQVADAWSMLDRRMRIAVLLALGMLGACLSGCKVATAGTPATAPTLATGAVDATDAKANQTLQTVHAFLAATTGDVQSGKLTLTADQLRILNNADRAANVAFAAEKAYHSAGGGDASVLLAAMTAVQTAFTAVQASLAAGVSP